MWGAGRRTPAPWQPSTPAGVPGVTARGKPGRHVDVPALERAGPVPSGEPLFDSMVVFENYPVDESATARTGVRV
ncbi:hypothetical protein, partial [Streptomyces sp. NPDC004658]|uniref:hypothetical protein n=1 Tax=Streptomyces sp. NPDC004658 TaxID=3154672 RepID=UPI0033A260E7